MSVGSPDEIPGEILSRIADKLPGKLIGGVSGEYLIEFPRETLVEFILESMMEFWRNSETGDLVSRRAIFKNV